MQKCQIKNNTFPIAKEGFKKICCLVFLLALATVLDFDFIGFFLFIALLFVIYVYRNPERLPQNLEDGSVVSPVDGEIKSIKDIDDEEFGYKIEIFSSYTDTSILRIPFNSKVVKFEKFNGARLASYAAASDAINENATLVLEDANLRKIKIKHSVQTSNG